MDLSQELLQVSLQVQAAVLVQEARWRDFSAALMVAGPKARESAREAVLAATEALLDANARQAYLTLKSQGIDPDNRHTPWSSA